MPVAVLLAAVDKQTPSGFKQTSRSHSHSHNLKSVFFSVTGENFKKCILANFPVLVPFFSKSCITEFFSLYH